MNFNPFYGTVNSKKKKMDSHKKYTVAKIGDEERLKHN